MSALMTLFHTCVVVALALALNACATPYGNAGVAGYGPSSGVASAQQALMGQQGAGMMPGMPFSNVGWQYAGSGFDPAMQPMIAAQQAMNTVYAVSPNVTVTHPMPQPSPTTTVGTASQPAPADGYATQAQLRAVAGRVHRNAEEATRAIEALRRRQRR